MKVCKFGGTSVGTVERMKHVATLIKDATPKIVVLSATAGTTNHLEEIAANLFNREMEQAHDRITRLEFQFIEFANGLLTDEKLKREAIDYILDRFQQLWKFTKKLFHLRRREGGAGTRRTYQYRSDAFLPARAENSQCTALCIRLHAYRPRQRTRLGIYRTKTPRTACLPSRPSISSSLRVSSARMPITKQIT